MAVIENEINKKYVEKRVKDWEKRVYQLYSTINSWLKNDAKYKIQVNKDLTLTMNEEFMYRFGVHPIEIKTASIIRDNRVITTIKPFGLWIIGANGAVEISNFFLSYKVIDTSEEFQASKWKIVIRKGFEENAKDFNKQELIKILDAAL